SRWKNGHFRNIPPGASSAESTACPIPRCVRKYDTCRAPGPDPTTTTGYSPGGNGRSPPAAPPPGCEPVASAGGSAVIESAPRVRVPEATGHRLEHPVRTSRVLREEGLEGRPAEHDAAQRP